MCLVLKHRAVVAATVGVVGKELIGCKFNVSGCCVAVRHRVYLYRVSGVHDGLNPGPRFSDYNSARPNRRLLSPGRPSFT